MGAIWDAQEDAHKRISKWDNKDTDMLSSALEDLAGAAQAAAEGYRENAANVNAIAEGNPLADEWEEKADNLDSWADELEATLFEEYDGTPDKESWIEDQRSEAETLVDQCPE
jgi:hypothetical protein